MRESAGTTKSHRASEWVRALGKLLRCLLEGRDVWRRVWNQGLFSSDGNAREGRTFHLVPGSLGNRTLEDLRDVVVVVLVVDMCSASASLSVTTICSFFFAGELWAYDR